MATTMTINLPVADDSGIGGVRDMLDACETPSDLADTIEALDWWIANVSTKRVNAAEYGREINRAKAITSGQAIEVDPALLKWLSAHTEDFNALNAWSHHIWCRDDGSVTAGTRYRVATAFDTGLPAGMYLHHRDAIWPTKHGRIAWPDFSGIFKTAVAKVTHRLTDFKLPAYSALRKAGMSVGSKTVVVAFDGEDWLKPTFGADGNIFVGNAAYVRDAFAFRKKGTTVTARFCDRPNGCGPMMVDHIGRSGDPVAKALVMPMAVPLKYFND